MTTDIRKRVDDLHMAPPTIAFHAIRDETNGVWLGKVTYTPWMLSNGSREDKARWDAAVTEGATPAEVLRKLAEMME